jgi:hypothetical protein
MHKLCSKCSQPAQFSGVAIISTIGLSARLQKSSPAVLFCDDCLRELCDRLCSKEFCEAVNSAYTTLNQLLRERSTAKDRIGG